MSGFVYIWFDRKHTRFYVGSHWGSPDDGYICSSRWMRKSYRRRPEDFKRRIIATVNTSRQDLLAEEQRWLQMMKPEELKGVRYYNFLTRTAHWTADDSQRKTVSEKLSTAIRKKRQEDPEYCERVRLATMEGHKRSRSETPEKARSADQKRSESMKRQWVENEEFRKKMEPHRNRLAELSQTEAEKERREAQFADEGYRSRHREAMNRPDVKEKCGKSMKGLNHKDETRALMADRQRQRREDQKRAATAHITDFMETFIMSNRSIAAVMRIYGISRKQVEYLIETS